MHRGAAMCVYAKYASKWISENSVIFSCVIVVLKGKLNEAYYNSSADWISTFETFKEFDYSAIYWDLAFQQW